MNYFWLNQNKINKGIFNLDASGNPVTATVPTTVETVVVTDASGSTVTGNFERFVYHNFIL